mmetsp:Transcript_4386/g.12106  ORF Transcript_4386/g.12106 Transcript_4386/m.12106 type:complete len:206 (-) Transcript_4386:76-693(-)
MRHETLEMQHVLALCDRRHRYEGYMRKDGFDASQSVFIRAFRHSDKQVTAREQNVAAIAVGRECLIVRIHFHHFHSQFVAQHLTNRLDFSLSTFMARMSQQGSISNGNDGIFDKARVRVLFQGWQHNRWENGLHFRNVSVELLPRFGEAERVFIDTIMIMFRQGPIKRIRKLTGQGHRVQQPSLSLRWMVIRAMMALFHMQRYRS